MSGVPLQHDLAVVQAAINDVLDMHAYPLVEAYYNPAPRTYGELKSVLFAGRYFDELGENESGLFGVGDLAAASLLDVRFGPHAVSVLLDQSECNDLLAKIPTDMALWDATVQQLDTDSSAWLLWNRLVGIPGIGRTRASKLLARKRPHLMPILDSVIVHRLGLENLDSWRALRGALTPGLRRRIDQLSHAATSHGASPPSTLRLLDVATWMRYSGSGQAQAVRRDLGVAGISDPPAL